VPIKVAIFGDSQATALFMNRPASLAASLNLTDASISACGIMTGLVMSRSGERFDLASACPNWLTTWRANAQKAKPDIALVVIGAWDLFDVQTAQGKLTFRSPDWESLFLTNLRSGLAAIRESGAQIALADLPCYRPRTTNPRPTGYWPERGDDDRTRYVNDLLHRLADGVHIITVAPAAAFCTDPAVGDNKSNRYDGVHYLRPGAAIYFDAIVPQLLVLPS